MNDRFQINRYLNECDLLAESIAFFNAIYLFFPQIFLYTHTHTHTSLARSLAKINHLNNFPRSGLIAGEVLFFRLYSFIYQMNKGFFIWQKHQYMNIKTTITR
jgi:hypothetical protein